MDSLQFWLDATKITNLNDGDPIPVYYELSSNADSLKQMNSVKQPTFQDNIINAKSSIYFDGG